jgi:hypothetical protein
MLAQARSMRLTAPSDARLDAFGPYLLAVLVVVVGPVAVQLIRALAWPTAPTTDRRYRLKQRF